MKTFKLMFGLLIPTFLILSIVRCNKTESLMESVSTPLKPVLVTNQLNKFAVNMTIRNVSFQYQAETASNITRSTLIIIQDGHKVSSTFNYEFQKRGYKFEPHLEVLRVADKIKQEFSDKQVVNQALLYELFVKTVLDEDIDVKSPLVQSLFFHNAVLNTIARSIEQKVDCECTPHPGFFVDKVPFFCQEDYYINPREFLFAIEKSGRQLSNKENEVYNYLIKHKGESRISIDRIFEIYESKSVFLSRINNSRYRIMLANKPNGGEYSEAAPCLEGSDLGCCGNYEGCCWYWSLLCLEHDIECICCSKWHCGWACVKEKGCK